MRLPTIDLVFSRALFLSFLLGLSSLQAKEPISYGRLKLSPNLLEDSSDELEAILMVSPEDTYKFYAHPNFNYIRKNGKNQFGHCYTIDRFNEMSRRGLITFETKTEKLEHKNSVTAKLAQALIDFSPATIFCSPSQYKDWILEEIHIEDPVKRAFAIAQGDIGKGHTVGAFTELRAMKNYLLQRVLQGQSTSLAIQGQQTNDPNTFHAIRIIGFVHIKTTAQLEFSEITSFVALDSNHPDQIIAMDLPDPEEEPKPSEAILRYSQNSVLSNQQIPEYITETNSIRISVGLEKGVSEPDAEPSSNQLFSISMNPAGKSLIQKWTPPAPPINIKKAEPNSFALQIFHSLQFIQGIPKCP